MDDKKNMDAPEKDASKTFCCFPVRYLVTLLGFWGFFNIYAMRVNLSVALVAMVNQTTQATVTGNDDDLTGECPALPVEEKAATIVQQGGQYNWDSKTQGVILGSFFYGYVLTQLPGGFLAEKFGAKWLFGGGVLVTAILSLITPLAASWGTGAFIAVRVMEGLGEGVTMPAMNALVSRWSPKFERSRLTTIIYTGCQIGNVIAMPISGWLCSSDILGGWPSVFYVFGALGCLWFLLWSYFVSDSPEDHPKMSSKELNYILEGKSQQETRQTPPVPWKKILTSVPVWALTLTHFGHSFGFLMLLTELPSYLNNVLHFNIQSDGLLSAVPYLVQAASAWSASYVADRIRVTGKLQISTIRKIFNSIGLFGPAICLLVVTSAGCQPTLIIGLISLALALNGFTYSGYNVTHVDMSPDFAGTLYGITNTVANLCGILGPSLVGYMTVTGNTIKNWNKVFYITTAVYIIAAFVYIIFATADLQHWSPTDKKTTEAESTDHKKPMSTVITVETAS